MHTVDAYVMDGRIRFWRSYIRLGFAILSGESAATLVYLIASPSGPHRALLQAIALVAAVVGAAGILVAPWAARQPWRTSFVLAWSLLSMLTLAVVAHLDGGLESPTVYLAVFPVAYTALVLPPLAVGICGALTATAILGVGVLDHSRVARENLAMGAAFGVGFAVLAVVSAVQRARLQRDEARLFAELERRGSVDELTGCLNYRAFHERLADEVERALRYDRSLCLLIADVDYFKDFNDLYGHAAGDAGLAAVGARFRGIARASDAVARIGGDEFALLAPEITVDEAAILARRLLEHDQSAHPSATLSVGIAALRADEPTAKRLFRDADAAMYDAKAAGRATLAVGRSGDLGMTHDGHRESADTKRSAERVRHARQENNETEMLLDALLEESPIGFAFVSSDFRVLRINRPLAKFGRRSPAEHVGRTLAEMVPGLWPQLEPLLRQVLHDGMALRNAEVVVPASMTGGAEVATLSNLFPFRVGGRVVGIGIVVIDINDRKQLKRSAEALTDAVVTALAATVEARDPYTAGHQRRVSDIATAIAQELGYDACTVKGIGLAAAIHDIGKVAVPAEILSRPGRLSHAELQLVQVHAEAGASILRDLDFPWPVAEMVHQHHERLDGSGYPRGLRDENICVGARIIAVADVVEAMSSPRPYRVGLGIDEALRCVEAGRGTLFDAAVVDACTSLFRTGRLHSDAVVNLS